MNERTSRRGSAIILVFVTLYLGLPVLATLLFSIAGRWDSTVLPESYTFRWYVKMLTEPSVISAIGRSFLVSGATVILSLLVITPATFIAHQYVPGFQPIMRFTAVLPFALPGVILAVGLIQLYSSGFLPIAGTFWILLFSYVIVCLPYVHNSITNSLDAIDARTLVEAAQSLGANRVLAFTKIVLPNIKPGLVSASLLVFAVSLGEFVLANMLVGGKYQTLQLILERMVHLDGHMASAIVVLYFILVATSSLLLILVARGVPSKEGKWTERFMQAHR